MEPQNPNPEQPVAGSAPAEAPVAPTVTPPATPNVQIPAPTVGVAPQAPVQSLGQNGAPAKSGKKWALVGGLIGLLVALVVVGLLLFLFVFSDAARSKTASKQFMSAMSSGDVDKAYKLLGPGSDDSDKQFLETAAKDIKGSPALKESALVNKKAYFLYEVAGANKKYVRTELEKKDSGWRVFGLVYDKQPLKLIASEGSTDGMAPSSDTSTETSSNTSTGSTTTTTASSCLSSADAADLDSNGTNYSEGATLSGVTRYSLSAIFFKADSTAYEYPDDTSADVVRIGKVYSKNKTKDFTVHLTASVRETSSSSAGVKLANDRAAKVTADLVAQGVPASIVKVDELKHSQDTQEVAATAERNVEVTLETPACN